MSDLCTSCEFKDYPVSYSPRRQAASIAVAATTLFTLIAGAVIFWLRRHERLVSQRDWLLSTPFVLCSLLWLFVPYREYYGEVS
jgi:hypothetical protein